MNNYIIKKVKKLYSTHTILKAAATAVLLILIAVLIKMAPVLMIRKNEIPFKVHEYSEQVLTQLSIDDGEVLAAESGGKLLYVNTKDMNLRVVDKETKKEWNALLPDSSQTADKALLSISYLGDDNNLYENDSYAYCTALGSYKIYLIEDGVKIDMALNEGESIRFYEYFPIKMPMVRYEDFFISGISQLLEDGIIDEARAARYEQTIKLVYRKSIIENCYAVANAGNPAVSATKLMIELAKLLGYDKEMLIADSTEFGLGVTFIEPASFEITFTAVLDEDDLVISVPVTEMVTHNDFYTIQNIKVLPNFGAATATNEGGYIFVPDGAGALFEFNSYSLTVPDYVRPVYDNDFYSDYYYMPEYGEELMMPVYGMTYGQDDAATHGFLAIIEEGADTSFIHTKLAGLDGAGSTYNKVFASFDVVQYSKVKVYGPFADNTATYLAVSKESAINYTVRYRLFPENVTYYDMASSYRDYLMEEEGIGSLSYGNGLKLYLDFIGGITLSKRFLGIPYDSIYSMTTYTELIDILTKEEDKDLVIEYSGFFNKGLSNELNNKAELVSKNGSSKDLAKLLEYIEQKGYEIFYETSLSAVYREDKGFSKRRHSVYDYTNNVAEIYRYFIPLGILDGYARANAEFHYIVSPHYLLSISEAFIKKSEGFDALSIPDLGNLTYADYKFRNEVSVYEASSVIDSVFKELSNKKKLSISDPYMKNLLYGSYATDISRESCDYRTFYTSIPFRQLVMNGLIQATTEDINMSSYSASYYMLQAVELGIYPKFTLTAKSVDILKDSHYAHLFSTQYEGQKETIDEVYSVLNEAFLRIGELKIINHVIVGQNVFRTDYAKGVSVITNYNLEAVEAEGHEIGAMSFLVLD